MTEQELNEHKRLRELYHSKCTEAATYRKALEYARRDIYELTNVSAYSVYECIGFAMARIDAALDTYPIVSQSS